MTMTTSAAGRQFITQEEGERLTAYQDSVGIWTIGVGQYLAGGPTHGYAGPADHLRGVRPDPGARPAEDRTGGGKRDHGAGRTARVRCAGQPLLQHRRR